jgi:tetratricopeptide (TPR) repeat protein
VQYRVSLSQLQKNGEFNSAVEAYDRLIGTSKEQLQMALLHNQHYQHAIDIYPIVQPLLNAMFVQADILESTKNLQKAERLRKEALELSQKHLSQST